MSEQAPKTSIKLGKDIEVGDRLALEDGRFLEVKGLCRAPIRIQYEDGSVTHPRWAMLSDGGHTTICAQDEYVVRA